MTLLGHFLGVHGGTARFADDLAASVTWGDARRADLNGLVERTCDAGGWPRPELPDPEPFDGGAPPATLDLAGLGAVIFAAGYRPAYSDWIEIPGAFDALGFPRHENGRSTAAPRACTSRACTSSARASRRC